MPPSLLPSNLTPTPSLLSALKPLETVLGAALVSAILPCSVLYQTAKSFFLRHAHLTLTAIHPDDPEQGHGDERIRPLLLDHPEGQGQGVGVEGKGYAISTLFAIEELYNRVIRGDDTGKGLTGEEYAKYARVDYVDW